MKDFGDKRTLKLQLFYDNLNNSRFVSNGFPAHYHAYTYETRLSFNFNADADDGLIKTQNEVGPSYRSYRGRQMETYNSGTA